MFWAATCTAYVTPLARPVSVHDVASDAHVLAVIHDDDPWDWYCTS
jgi:hypothetical protein